MKKITIIGTGYVGLVTGAGLADFGNEVICADILESKVNQLKKGEIPFFEPGLKELIDRNVNENRLSFTAEIEKSVQLSEVIFIAVGTPELSSGQADLSHVIKVSKLIGENLNFYKVICTKSTVPIGTGKKICKTINENIKSVVDFDYVSNPEFLREGSSVKDFLWPDRVVIGAEETKAFEILKEVYRPLYVNKTPIMHTNIETSEMIKYASNAFLALKISYINEIANLCDKVGADVHQVATAMGKDGRISSKFLHPGPGYGGSCFPKDTKALVNIAKENGLNFKTIEAAIIANENQKIVMFKKLKKLLQNQISGKSIGILGLSFKPNTDDIRESSSLKMISFLIREGAIVKSYDPVVSNQIKNIYPDLNCCSSLEECVADTDAIVIMTDWNVFRSMDLKKVFKIMKKPVILDTRNILSTHELNNIGFKHDNVGRKSII